jgi:hypothetical protein
MQGLPHVPGILENLEFHNLTFKPGKKIEFYDFALKTWNLAQNYHSKLETRILRDILWHKHFSFTNSRAFLTWKLGSISLKMPVCTVFAVF